ncbi:MAG: pitrilysin family protein [bacterium]|nr:pitrilysin family protein [bacterium]
MQTHIHTLPNGLRVVLVDTNSFPTLTTLLLVGSGSRYENEKNNGIAHFLEHMFFKGSKKYQNSFMISSTLEGLGAISNAFTSKDHTGYWIKSTNEHFEKVVDVLSDMLLEPFLLQEEIDREKGVIVEELNMYEDTPARRVGEIFENLLYKGNPLGFDIGGTKDTVVSFNRNTFVDYMNQLYFPSNAVLVVAGGFGRIQNSKFKIQNYLDVITAKFGSWKGKKDISLEKMVENQKETQVIVKHKKSEQAHVCIGFRTFSYYDTRKYILSLLTTVLGGGMSSRLFMEVREKRGLCYYISSGRENYSDVGSIVTQAGVPIVSDKVNETIAITLQEHKKMTQGEVTEEELTRAKELIKGRVLLSMEDSQNVASFYGVKKLLQDKIETPKEIIEKLEKVTADQVTDLAKEIFVQEGLNVALVGPFEKSDIKVSF